MVARRLNNETLDVDSLGDDGAEEFLNKHSSLWGKGEPHGYDRITRKTNIKLEGKTEHESEIFIDKSVFSSFKVK